MAEAGTKLTEEEIRSALKGLAGWEYDGKSIKKLLSTSGYPATMGLVTAIGSICQKKNHHPDFMLVKFKEVDVSFSTHSAGGVTLKDIEVATEIQALRFP